MDTTSTRSRAVAVLVAGAFGVAAPLSVASLAHAAVQGHASSHSRDSDGDKMPNRWETKNGLDAHKANARGDADRDGLANLAEFRDGTDPQDDDSDDDGVEDGDDSSPTCDDSTSDDSASDDSASDDSCDDSAPAGTRLATYVVS